jgi:hypothetical protein
MHLELTDYFRCPEEFVSVQPAAGLSGEPGYFRFGPDTVCYGRSSAGLRAPHVNGHLYDVANDVRFQESVAELPFDPTEVASNLRYERYAHPVPSFAREWARGLVRGTYYWARPVLPIWVRKHLQKLRLRRWRELTFPRWPVDTNVDNLMEQLLAVCIRRNGGKSVPFIWFWPQGMNACALMTHDVEEAAGVALCSTVMDMNESFGIPASFQVVPERRYHVSEEFLDGVRQRGFEINVHDLNHDGQLFQNQDEFRRRAAKINHYGRAIGAVGFRAGVLYRNQDWYDALDFEYDSSVPNVAHLDPQRGGCCTVMPYFVGKLVELPVTTTQDYALFHVLNNYGTGLWEEQIKIILEKHGLINVIVHPDYLTGPREREMYRDLLGLYARLRREQNVWITLPREANTWWRQRSQMRLVRKGGEWQIEGPNKERAVIAFASLENNSLTYRLSPPQTGMHHPAPQDVAAKAV